MSDGSFTPLLSSQLDVLTAVTSQPLISRSSEEQTSHQQAYRSHVPINSQQKRRNSIQENTRSSTIVTLSTLCTTADPWPPSNACTYTWEIHNVQAKIGKNKFYFFFFYNLTSIALKTLVSK